MNPNRWGVRENFVYWLFDENDVCLYVGLTRRPEYRWRQHCWERAKMAGRVARKRMAGPYLIETARRIEREQQLMLLPTFSNQPHVSKARRLAKKAHEPRSA